MNKTKVLITVLCFVMVAALSVSVFATQIGNVNVEPNENSNGTNIVVGIGNTITGILQVVGIVISVIILMVLGIKYMMGSAEEKAEYKKTFIPFIIGAVLLFGASIFAKAIYNFAADLVK